MAVERKSRGRNLGLAVVVAMRSFLHSAAISGAGPPPPG